MVILTRTLGAFLAVVSFGVILEAPRKLLVWSGVSGGVCWLFYLLVQDATSSAITAALVSGLAVAFTSHVFARIFKAPVTVFLIPGILPSVPGASIYRSVYYMIRDMGTLSTYHLMQTLQIAGAIAMAVFIVDSVFRLIFRREKQQKCGR